MTTIRMQFWTIVVATLAIATASTADDARKILDEAKARNDAHRPKDVEREIHMTLTDARGAQRSRELRIYSIDKGNESTKTLVFLLAPADVKGVGLLSWGHKDKASEQWLYLPTLARVRRITGETRRESFQGSDFTYTDLEILNKIHEWTEEEAKSSIVKDADSEDGVSCTVIQLSPTDTDLEYGRILVWLAPVDGTVRKLELYDRAEGSLAKTLKLSRYTTIAEFPSAQRLEMLSTQGSRTVLEFSNVRYDQGFREEMFAERSLERGRVD